MKLKAVLLALLVAGFATSMALASESGQAKKPDPKPAAGTASSGKVLICHRTGSAKRPYALVRVSKRAAAKLIKRGDVAASASGGCPSSLATALQTTSTTTTTGATTTTTGSTTTTTGTTTTTTTTAGCDTDDEDDRDDECDEGDGDNNDDNDDNGDNDDDNGDNDDDNGDNDDDGDNGGGGDN